MSAVHGIGEGPLAPLPRDFYLRPTVDVARDLLGRYLVFDRGQEPPHIGKLVEVEAYIGAFDLASHASRGHTRRTAPMFEEAGHAYVYLIYGMYWCLNVVTEDIGNPCAVLIRGVEPIAGLEGATNGPGKLCRAYGIDGAWNRADMTSSSLRITVGEPVPATAIGASPRIGVDYAQEWAAELLRFFIAGNPFVSRPARSKGGVRRRSIPSPPAGEG
jgi:DNA-3-methyladenine glycosylase